MSTNRGWPTLSRWGHRHTLLSACVGSYFGVRFAQVVVGPVVPAIVETFGVSRGTLGAALTGMWVVYALSQLPSGVLADRFGERGVVLVALGTTALAALGLAASPAFLPFGVGLVLLGVGAGIYYNPATALLAREFDPVGRAVGTHRIGGQAAGVAAPLAAAAVGLRYDWRTTVLVGVPLAVLAALLIARSIPPASPVRPGASIRDLFDPGDLASLLARPHARYTTFVATLVEFVGLATMAFLPALLLGHQGLPSRPANLLFAVFFATTALSQPLAGWLSDRLGRDRTLALQAAAGVLGFGALATGSRLLVVPGVLLAGIAMSATPVVQSRMIDGLDESDQGAGFGVFRTVYLLLGASGTAVVGTAADVAGWAAAFGLLAVALAVVLLSLGAVRTVGSRAA
jgi:MFS family permease